MKEIKLTITHFKILDTIKELNSRGMYPLSDGIYKIVAGVVDEETMDLMDLSTFGTLISFNSKKICRYLLMLKRYGYLNKIYNKKDDALYYALTNLGDISLMRYHKKHKRPYIKKKRVIKKTILRT